MNNSLLAVICGWPISGKSTIAREISEQLDIHHIDIDENIRLPVFGIPHPHPNKSKELMQRDRQEMAASYRLLIAAAHEYLQLERSVIITATFSRKIGQDMISGLIEQNPHASLKVIWCLPKNDTEKEIRKRLSKRSFGDGYVGGVNSMERYREVKDRYEPIELNCLTLDTSPPNTPEDCAERVLKYILEE